MKMLLLLIISSVSLSQSIKVTNQFIRLLPPSAPNTGGFLTLKNTSKRDIKLIKAEANISKTVELHTLIKENDVMKMREVSEILIPAGGETQLKPGGLHLMFMGLKKALKEKAKIDVILFFSDSSSLKFKFPVLNK